MYIQEFRERGITYVV